MNAIEKEWRDENHKSILTVLMKTSSKNILLVKNSMFVYLTQKNIYFL